MQVSPTAHSASSSQQLSREWGSLPDLEDLSDLGDLGDLDRGDTAGDDPDDDGRTQMRPDDAG